MSHPHSLPSCNPIDTSTSPYESYNDAKLQRATETIDELTKALAQFISKNPSVGDGLLRVDPECQCGHPEGWSGRNCDTARAWRKDRSRLEEKLVLSAGELIYVSQFQDNANFPYGPIQRSDRHC